MPFLTPPALYNPQMKLRIKGSFETLKQRLKPLALGGEWLSKPNGIWILRCDDGAGLSAITRSS